ncbi:hypothetical protein [Streptococcus gordonii]|uniref:Uncharacterized protein n=1 Tax=Streptococcus gordonii (strain Challis / ATCC 35105 / BCRC 15272 / CH1 / DL1 / V288) TaxID=467705 RepID=A8AUC7_STRGC|nr:hypothetical protein [Streptococcus gordonii]ABV11104.1 hypothetical protein SGO_0065 [Streptococcus gordonii str. Challis substr. CH1]MBZ2138356.1 hypothetical protein [Streptococcus gordonii]QGS44447.1 hypothetical protein FOB91_07060 [Streptococcus gordonii]VEE20148.1 Uncharacterised protein [Streptococcus gordonii]
MSKKYDVLIQPFDYDKDRIYVTFGYTFGFALQEYRIDNEIYRVNPASILFLANIKKRFAQEILGKNIEISVNPGNTTLSFVSNSKKIEEDIKKLNQFLLYNPNEVFEKNKKEFVEEYLTKENDFPDIFNLSILEFLGQNKRFSRYNLFNQIQKVTSEDVRFVQEILFQGMESKVFILGNVNENVIQMFEKEISLSNNSYHPESIFFPLTSDDIVPKEIVVKERGKRGVLIHSNPSFFKEKNELLYTSEDVFLTYQILTEHYKKFQPILAIDGADMGMYIPEINKIERHIFNDEILIKYIEKIRQQNNYLLQEKPKIYANLFVVLWLSGVNYLEYNSSIITESLEAIRTSFSIVLDDSLFCIVNSN